MDNLLSVKRGRIIAAVGLNLVLVVCLVFVYFKLSIIQNIIVPSVKNEPGFKEMFLIVLTFKIGLTGLVGFTFLHTLNLAKLRIYYDDAGIQLKSLFRNWKTSWLQLELAYIGKQSLFIKSSAGSLSIPFRLLSGDLDRLASYIPAEVLLDKDSALRQEKKRGLKLLLVVALISITVAVAFERFFVPYLAQVEEQIAQSIDKYADKCGVKIIRKKHTN